MSHRLIEMPTLLGMPPVERVKLAAELGCVSISTGLASLPLAACGYAQLCDAPRAARRAWSRRCAGC